MQDTTYVKYISFPSLPMGRSTHREVFFRNEHTEKVERHPIHDLGVGTVVCDIATEQEYVVMPGDGDVDYLVPKQ